MANNFFDLVKISFFKPFANGDVRLNYDLLQLINEEIEVNLIDDEEERETWKEYFSSLCDRTWK